MLEVRAETWTSGKGNTPSCYNNIVTDLGSIGVGQNTLVLGFQVYLLYVTSDSRGLSIYTGVQYDGKRIGKTKLCDGACFGAMLNLKFGEFGPKLHILCSSLRIYAIIYEKFILASKILIGFTRRLSDTGLK